MGKRHPRAPPPPYLDKEDPWPPSEVLWHLPVPDPLDELVPDGDKSRVDVQETVLADRVGTAVAQLE